ncbi:unnamed protein product, partial [marine sediment metagenome]
MGSWFRWIKKLYQNLNEKLEGVKAGKTGVGNTYFVDGQDGLDTNDGLTRDAPFKTIAYALTKCVALHDDYILVLRGGGQTHPIAVTVDRVHIIGITNKGTPQTVSGYAAGAHICMTIDAEHVEIAGLTFLADTTHPAIDVLSQCWGLWVHHCSFGEAGIAQHGIAADNEGPVGGLIEHNYFGEAIAENGCHFLGPTRTIIRNNVFRCLSGVGIYLAGGSFGAILDNVFAAPDANGAAIKGNWYWWISCR